jgi:hypothetical protein
MSSRDLARALLELEAGLEPVTLDPRQLAREVVARDRRRLRLLAGLTILLWLAAGAGLVLLVLSLHWYIRWVRISTVLADAHRAAAPAAVVPSRPPYEVIEETSLLHHSTPYVLGSIAALLLAGFCTVQLILASRRAALRQVSAALMDISEQLKRLGKGEGGP